RESRLYHQKAVAVWVIVGVGKVLHVGGDIRGHRDTAVGDVLDKRISVAYQGVAGRRQVVGHRGDDVARAPPEEGRDDRIAAVWVRGDKSHAEECAALAERAVLLVEDNVRRHHVKHRERGTAVLGADGVAAGCGEQCRGQKRRNGCEGCLLLHGLPPCGVPETSLGYGRVASRSAAVCREDSSESVGKYGRAAGGRTPTPARATRF